MNFEHRVRPGLGVRLMRVFVETENRHFWVRTPNNLLVPGVQVVKGFNSEGFK